MPLAVRESLRHTGPRALEALHRHPLLSALLLAAVVTATLLLALTPRFETNDDIAMQAVVDGTLTGRPQPDLIVTNVIVGLVLAGLYRAAEGFPWYGAYLFLLQFLALAALTYVVLAGRREGLAGRLLLLGGVVAVFYLPLWLGLQFTSTAILVGAAGVALFRSVADRAGFPWASIAGAAAMVGIAWWMRWRSGAAVILLGAVFLAPALRRANGRRFAAFAGIVLAFLAAGWTAQAIYYGGRPEWQEYFAFNELRGQLHESSHLLEVDPAVLAEVGWSPNDLLMFDNWFFSDEATYQAEDLRGHHGGGTPPLRGPRGPDAPPRPGCRLGRGLPRRPGGRPGRPGLGAGRPSEALGRRPRRPGNRRRRPLLRRHDEASRPGGAAPARLSGRPLPRHSGRP